MPCDLLPVGDGGSSDIDARSSAALADIFATEGGTFAEPAARTPDIYSKLQPPARLLPWAACLKPPALYQLQLHPLRADIKPSILDITMFNITLLLWPTAIVSKPLRSPPAQLCPIAVRPSS